jgi:hypothetical protein
MGSAPTNCQSTVRDPSSDRASFPFRQVKTLPKTSRIELEAQLIEAHAKLTGMETLVRLGSFEVRLIHPLSRPPASSVRFWLELFDHDRQLSIDSVGDRVIADAVIAADEFIARVTKLSENPHTWRRLT